jgi:hypothetical protein
MERTSSSEQPPALQSEPTPPTPAQHIRASCRSARGRTSICQPPRGRLTRRQRHPADERTGGGTGPHPGPGLPRRQRAPRPRQRARHLAATRPSTRPTPVLPAAATPWPRPARQNRGQDGLRPLLGDGNKYHGPFGVRISMIPNGPWCYGLSLPPRFTCSARRQSRWLGGSPGRLTA